MNEHDGKNRSEFEEPDPLALREILGYWDQFDVFLTAPFRDCEGSTSLFEDRFPFYERIGSVVSGLGKSIFLLHRDLDRAQNVERERSQLFDIIIPSSKLEIAYFPLSPHFESLERVEIAPRVRSPIPTYTDRDMIEWDLMWSKARTSRVPSISLYHSCAKYPYVRGMPNQVDEIPFETEEEALGELERSLKNFFRPNR